MTSADDDIDVNVKTIGLDLSAKPIYKANVDYEKVFTAVGGSETKRELWTCSKAFPQELSGIYTTDEMGQTETEGSKEQQEAVLQRKLQEINRQPEYPAEVEKLIAKMGTKRETILQTINELFFELMEKHGANVANHLQASQLQKFGALNIGALNVRQYRELVLAMWQLLQEEPAGLQIA